MTTNPSSHSSSRPNNNPNLGKTNPPAQKLDVSSQEREVIEKLLVNGYYLRDIAYPESPFPHHIDAMKVITVKPEVVDQLLALIANQTAAAKEDQVMIDFLAYNVELNNDESELIAVRDMLLAQLTTTKEKEDE